MRLAVFASSCARLLGAGVLALSAWVPAQATVTLQPLLPGTFAPGQGADAAFYKIDNAWHGSTVLWDEDAKKYGSGLPIGSYDWGTGLWGRADWNATQAAAGGAGGPPIQASWQGLATTINYGNQRYNDCYTATWGAANLMPLPQTSFVQLRDCTEEDGAHPSQHNWTAHFWGYIRIADADLYNFSVLNDDGFFFRLVGENGQEISIGRDFLNSRDRNGFSDMLDLGEGLYGFELGMWNRLGAGVVDLRWLQGADDESWELVPVTNLVSIEAVPAPPAWALAMLALGLLGAGRRAPRRSMA